MSWLYKQLFVAVFAMAALLSATAAAADPAPSVTSVNPGVASNVGGDSVLITGTGFTPESTVTFGFFQALSVTYIDTTTLQAVVPVSDEAGAVAVSVKNIDGQLGSLPFGLTLTRADPSLSSIAPTVGPVAGGTTVTASGAGFYGGIRFNTIDSHSNGQHACGIAAGKLYCWGDNSRGQLGDGTTTARATPASVDTSGLLAGRRVVAVSAGGSHTLAMTSDGKLLAWGYNDYGQLGNGTIVDSLVPTEVDMTGALAGKAIRTISAGDGFNLVVTTDNEIYSWGQNTNGQLGTSNTLRSSVPTPVTTSGALAGKTIVTVVAGTTTSHALDSDGKAYGWGYNLYGRLGDGTTSQRTAPVAVIATGVLSGKRLVAIDSGSGGYTIALDSDGKAYGWGYGTSGQLGQGTSSNANQPVAVVTTGALSGKRLVAIGAAANSAVALDSEGALYGWGANNYGQLADTSTAASPNPRLVGTVGATDRPAITSLSMGIHSGYATTVSGDSYSWGYNTYGQLAVGDTTMQRQLVEMIDQLPRTLGLTVGGVATSIADWRQDTLGFKTPAHPAGLVDITLIENSVPVATITDAFEYTSPPTVTGAAPASASNSGGDILTISGIDFKPGVRVQVGLRVLSDVTYVDSGTLQVTVPVSDQVGAVDVMAINPDGQKYTLKNGFSYVGTPPTVSGLSPVAGPVKGGQDVVIDGAGFMQNLAFTKVAAAGNHACGISNGVAYCWGDNTSGQLGDGTKFSHPGPVAAGVPGALMDKTLVAIDTGTTHTVAVDAEGKVYAWGDNSHGQLGDGTMTQRLTPVAVDMSGVLLGRVIVDVSVGVNHTAVLDSEGRVYTWGNNGNGQLGDSSTTSSSVPVAVYTAGDLAGKVIRSVTLGQSFSMALDSEGRVYGWGSNGQGQLGINSVVSPRVPTAMYTSGALGGRAVQAIATGESSFALVLDVEGQVYGMGYNAFGQVGNNSTTPPQAPTAVYGIGVFAGKRIVSIAAGEHHSIALDSEGKLYSWGSNNSGQYGDGSLASVRYPVAAATSGSVVGKGIIGMAGGKYHSLFVDSGGKIHGAGANSAGQLGTGVIASTVSIPQAAAIQAATPLKVMFGDVAGTIASQSESSLTAITPPHVAGLVDVAVIPYGAEPITLSGAYTYLEPPRITDITPSSGAVSGGDLVTIVGADFTPSAHVMIDDTRVDPTYINSSTLTFTMPAALTSGEVNVRVVNVDGQSATAPLAYEYQVAPPVVTAISPVSGPVSGGNTLSVSGSGFVGQSRFVAGGVGPTGGSSFGLTSTGQIYAWGLNTNDSLGDGTATQRNAPVRVGASGVMAGKTITKVAVGHGFGLALDADGILYGWGYNGNSQLGNGGVASAPNPGLVDATGVLAGKKIVDISAGSGYSLALDEDGVVYSWGVSTNGQLGNGGTTQQSRPVLVDRSGVLAGKKIVKIFAGYDHAFAADEQGALYGWGTNATSSLGDGTTTRRLSPVALSATGALAGVKIDTMAAGRDNTIAISQDGRVFAWGRNNVGQLGNGATTTAAIPVEITNSGALAGKRIVAVSLNGSVSTAHAVARDDNGGLYGWGYNQYGGIGNGEASSVSPYATLSPVKSDTNIPMKDVFAGTGYSCGISYSGIYYCWGQNNNGQLGDDTLTNRVDIAPIARASLASEASFSSIDMGGVSVTASNASTTSFSFVAPPHEPGVVDLSLMSGDSPLVTKTNAYEYLAPPAITGVTPSEGSVRGGDVVTVTGSHIKQGATVKFGSVEADQVVWLSEASLLVTTPVNYAGPKSITVTNPDGQLVTLRSAFIYRGEPPTITSITPNAGSMAGEQTVTVTGAGYDVRRQRQLSVVNATGATILNANITIRLNTAALIVAGKMRADGGDIRLSDASGGPLPYYVESGINTTNTLIWTTVDELPAGESTMYLSYGTSTMESESDASILGGRLPQTLVADSVAATVGGETFMTSIRFGDGDAGILDISDTTITVRSPSHAPGIVDVTIKSAYSDPAVAQDAYTFLPASYVFKSPPLNVASAEPGEMVIEMRDDRGEPVTSSEDVVLGLDTSSDAGYFATSRDASAAWDVVSVIVPAGESSAKVYYKDNLQGSPTISVTDAAGTQATQQQAIGPKYKLLVTGVSDPLRAGVPSSVTVQAVDAAGNPQSDYTGTVRFSSSDPSAKLPREREVVADDRGRNTFVNGVTMMSAGERCLTVTDTEHPSVTGSQCDITVLPASAGTPSKLQIITPAQSFPLSEQSTPITVQAHDVDGDPAITVADLPVYLHSSSSTGQFSPDGITWSSTPLRLVMQSGTSSINVYYRDTTAGEHTLTVRDEAGTGEDIGWTNAQQLVTVGVGAASKLKISADARVVTGVWTPIRIGLGDASNNSVTAQRDVAFSLTSDSATARFSMSADGMNASATLTGSVATGSQYLTVYVFDTNNHQLVLQASDTSPPGQAFGAGSLTVQVGSATAHRVALMPVSDTKIYESTEVHAYLQDEFGNTVLPQTRTEVSFGTSRESGGFSSVSDGPWTATYSAGIEPGRAGLSVLYQDTKRGVAELTASSEGLLAGVTDVTILPQAYDHEDGGRLSFSLAPASITTDDTSNIGVTLIDKYGEVAVAASPVTIQFALTAGQYSTDNTAWLSGATIVIPAGESTATAAYRNHTSGSAILRAHDASVGLGSRISHSLRVDGGAPTQLVFTNSAHIVATGGVTEPFVAQLRDAYGNDTVARGVLSGVIRSSSSTGEFSLDGLSGWSRDLPLSFAQNATSQNIYYRDITAGTHTTSLTGSELSGASQTVRVVEGFVDRLKVSAPVSAAAGTVVPIVISSHMATGEEVAVVGDAVIQLRGAGEFSLTEDPFTPISSLTLRDGQSRAEIFYRAGDAGVATLRAFSPLNDWTEGTASVAITPGNFYALTFSSAPMATPVNESSDEFVVSAMDMFGNITLVDSPSPVYLYSDSGSGGFSTTPGVWGASSAVIEAGTSSQSFHYKDATLGRTVAITASDVTPLDNPDTGILNARATLKVTGQTVERLSFLTPDRTVGAGEFSDIITIQAQKADGSPAVQGEPLAVSVTGATGDQFFTARNDSSRVNTLVIPAGESTVSFYVKPASVGERSLEVQSDSVSGSQSLTVTAGEPVELVFTSGPQSIVAGEVSAQITFSLRDAFGNTTAARGDMAISLSSSCAAAEFSLATGTSWAGVSTLTIPSGQSSGLFYYRTSTAAWCTITASANGYEPVEYAIYVRPAEGVRLELDAPARIGKGETVTVTASLRDAFGNSVTNKGSHRALYFSSSSSRGEFDAVMRYMSPGYDTVSVTYRDLGLGSQMLTVKDQTGAADTGWSDASTATEVVRGEASAVAFVESTMNAVAGEPRQVQVELRNQYGASYEADADMTVSVNSSVQDGYFTTNPGQGSGASVGTVTIRAGQSRATAYYTQQSVAAAQLSASAPTGNGEPAITTGTATVSVISATVDGLRFVSPPSTGEANEPRPLTVEARDRFGNASVFTSDTVLHLHTSSPSGTFMLSANGGPVMSISVPAGSTGATVYYKDQSVGSAELTVSDRPYSSEPAGIDNAIQQFTVTAPTPSMLVFVDAPSSMERGEVSGKIGVEVRSRFDVPVASQGERTLYLAEGSGAGEFALSPSGPWNVTELRLADGQSRADVYYRNLSSIASFDLVASDVSSPAESPDSGLANARHALTVDKGEFAQLRFETAPLVQSAKHPSLQVIVAAYNRYGVKTSVDTETSLYLRSTHAGAEFSANASTWGVNRVTLVPGEGSSSVSFFYRDPQAGTPIITVSTKQTADPGAITATQEQIILLQQHAGFLVTNIADPQYLGTPSSLVVAAVDAEGYIIDWYDGTITVSSSDPATVLPEPYTFVPRIDRGIHTFTNGVAFTSMGEKSITVTDQDGKSGQQTAITVLGPATTQLERLAFIEPRVPYTSTPHQSSPLMTIQAQAADGGAYVAGAGGLPVQLRSSNASGQFSLSPNGPWQSNRVVTIPRGLSYVNVYYRDADGLRATLTGADWNGGRDDAAIENATFLVLGVDEEAPVENPDVSSPSQPTAPEGSPQSEDDTTQGGVMQPGAGGDASGGSAPLVPSRGRMPIIGTGVSTAPTSLVTILPDGLVRVLQSPATQFVFPVLLFALLLLVAIVLLRQVYLEARRAREVRAILAKAAQTAHDKNEFLTIAAHYLRTPISIIGAAAGMLARTGTEPTLAEQITGVAQSLSSKSEAILAETESRQEMQMIDESQVSATSTRIYRSPLFWLPVALSVAVTLLINWAINDVGGRVSGTAYLEQVLLFVLGAALLYTVLRQRYVSRERRELLETTATSQAALDTVKNEFVARTYEDLSSDVAQLIAYKNQLDLTQPVTKVLEDGSRRLLSLVAKFQTLSQIESLQVRPTEFGADDLLQRAMTPLEEAALAKRVVLTTAIPPAQLQQDERLVTSVLSSVLANAIDYSPAGGQVSVAAESSNGQLVVTVSDEGPGFSRDPAELMRPFERGESAESVEHEGIGLSLYLDKIIMDHLGGQIEAANTAGAGARVIIRVPTVISPVKY